MPISKIKQSGLDASALTGSNISDGTIAAADLATDAVTTVKIADDAITTAKITNDSVTTAKIADTVNLGRRNLVINGAMQIHERAESVSGVTTNGYHTLDRWAMEGASSFSGSIGVNMSISSGPDEFSKAFKYTATANDTLSAAKYLMCNHKIEAQNLTHLKYGTSDAKSLTISFWVKSSATGNYALNLYSNDSGTARDITQLYTINAANTWEYKTLTFVGDPSGGINDDTGVGIWFQWFVRAGSDYTSGSSATSQAWNTHAGTDYAVGHTADPMATSGGTWEITGVQIEVGDTATPFEHRSYGEELRACQRYFFSSFSEGFYPGETNGSNLQRGNIAHSLDGTQNYAKASVDFPVEMRALPTVTVYNTNNGTVNQVSGDGSNYTANTGFIGTRRAWAGVSNISIATSTYLRFHITADAEI